MIIHRRNTVKFNRKEVLKMPRRGENIYKRRDGRWEGRYIASYDSAGKAKYRAVYARSYNEVKQKMQNARSDNSAKPRSSPVAATVSGWFEEWLLSLKNRIKESTYAIYKRYIDNHIRPFFMNLPLQKLNGELTQQFVDSKRELSPSTVHDIFVFFRTGVQCANKHFSLTIRLDDVILPKYAAHSFRVFSKAEQQRIENAIDSSADAPNYIGVFICLYTGLRIGEVCALEWTDINFSRNMLTVNKTIQRIADFDNGGTKVVITAPKSPRSIREIPLPEFLSQRLRAHKEKYGNNCGYILNVSGKPMEPRTYQYQFQKLLKLADVEKANFHTLRHTFSTRALELGFDVETLSEILGHANAAITLKKYAHSLDEHKRSSMERLSQLHGM